MLCLTQDADYSYHCSVVFVCLLVTSRRCAKTDEPIEMPFGVWTYRGRGKEPRNRWGLRSPPREGALLGVISRHGWLGSRVISVLESGAEGPGFKSQPRRCRVTVLGKLFASIVLFSPSSEIGSSPLKGCEHNCRPGGK